jgi:acetylornithine deacetylase/succinyl-diaminopimelate desuccinylase-like protein
VLAFTADEEDTAEFGARWLVQRHPELFEGCTEAVGESGAFTYHAGPRQRLYPIASAERGTAWLKLTARGQASHGAKPNPDNAVTRLSAAMARIGAHRWPVRLIPTVRAAVEAIAEAAGRAEPAGGFGALEPDDLLAYLGPAAVRAEGAPPERSGQLRPVKVGAGARPRVPFGRTSSGAAATPVRPTA